MRCVKGGFIVLKGIKCQNFSSQGYYSFHLLFFNSGKLGIFCSDANWEYRVIRGAIRLANTLDTLPKKTWFFALLLVVRMIPVEIKILAFFAYRKMFAQYG